MSRIYTFKKTFTNPGAVTLLQIAAHASHPIVILRAEITQSSSTTSAQNAAQFEKKSVGATVTAAVLANDIFEHDTDDIAPFHTLGVAATGHTATAEGTLGELYGYTGFNMLNGWLYLPIPEERIELRGSDILGLKLLAAFTGTLYAKITYMED